MDCNLKVNYENCLFNLKLFEEVRRKMLIKDMIERQNKTKQQAKLNTENFQRPHHSFSSLVTNFRQCSKQELLFNFKFFKATGKKQNKVKNQIFAKM